MDLALLTALQLAFSLLFTATGAAWSARWGRRAPGRSMRAAAVLLPAAFHGYLAWKALDLRFGLGVEHAPWVAALALLLAHAALVPWILVRAGRGELPGSQLALAALLALALECGLLWNLELRSRTHLLEARLAAGRIAYRLAPGHVDRAENAAPLYASVVAELFDGPQAVDPRPWSEALREGTELPADDARLRALLEQAAPALERAREASRLAHCSFEDGAGEDYELVRIPRVLPLYELALALALEGRVRAQSGDAAGALADAGTLYRIAEHLAQTPLVVLLLTASAVRELGDRVLVRALSVPDLDAAELAASAPRRGNSLADRWPDMVALEEACGLGLASSMAEARQELYLILRVERELAGYRAAMAELARRPTAPAGGRRPPRRQGLLAGLLTPPLDRAFDTLSHSDTQGLLVPAALAATRLRAERGAWPREVGELGPGFEGVRLEGDGEGVRITLTDPGGLERPPEWILPDPGRP